MLLHGQPAGGDDPRRERPRDRDRREKSPEVLRRAVRETAELLPAGRAVFLKEQNHNVSMNVLAPVLAEFFKGE